MVILEELNLDIIRVVSYPGSIFKYDILYKYGRATGMAGVYSYDDEWYYLYKKDTEKYKVRRRKDLENQKPYVLYEPEGGLNNTPPKNYSLSNLKQVAEGGNSVMERNLNEEIQQFFGDRFTAPKP